MKIKIAATVILYNPEDDVYENISSYSDYVDFLILVDNSNIYNNSLIEKLKSKHEKLVYINNHKNLGIAQALNIACDKAITNHFDWILTMDQDSRFINFKDYLEVLNTFSKIEYLALLTSNYDGGDFSTNIMEYEEKKFAITSGSILNLNCFKKIGKFEEKLFIDEVDHDYCARVTLNKFKIFYFKNIHFNHKIGYSNNNISQHNKTRVYYIVRNNLYMASKYGKIFKEYQFKKIIYNKIYKKFFRILRKEDEKFEKIKNIFLAIFHFLINNYKNKV